MKVPPHARSIVWRLERNQGLREAHIRDGVALTAFLSWAEGAMAAGEAGRGGGIGWPLTEYTVAEKLDKFR